MTSTKYIDKLNSIKTKSQKIALIGLGSEISQFYSWLVDIIKFEPKNIYLIDQGDDKESEFWQLVPNNQKFYNSEKFTEINNIDNIELVVKAPGIWSKSEELENFRKIKGKDSIVSSMVFFVEKFRERIIGITGTKGKTTTASLVKHLLEKEIEIKYCGNSVGISPYKYWNNQDSIFILELSSFQLQDLGNCNISPKFAVITNYYVDHLDVHKNVNEYLESKNKLYQFQQEGEFLVCTSQFYNHPMNKRKKGGYIISSSTAIGLQNIIESTLVGEHNYSNIGLAICIQYIILAIVQKKRVPTMGEIFADLDSRKNSETNKIIIDFKPVRHRLELGEIKVINNIEFYFYNDSQATTQESVIAGLSSLARNTKHGLWAIVGGKAKTDNFDPLKLILNNLHASDKLLRLDLFDEVGEIISPELKFISGSSTKTMRNFFSENIIEKQIIMQAENLGLTRVNIVLSPSGSSFNEFTNYQERGDMFIIWAKNHVKFTG
jgi:UDP-N-acetylmuramoylalanine--D-glutamate ligase